MIIKWNSKDIPGAYREAVQKETDMKHHVPMLKNIANNCAEIVEFGVRHGVSTIAFLAGQPSLLTSYDLKEQPAQKQIKEMLDSWNTIWVTHYGNILKTTKENPPPECDLMMFDSEHSYEQLSFELQFANQAKKYLIFHDTETFKDTANVPNKEGIGRAIDEFRSENPHWQVLYETKKCNGLLILERKND